MEITENAKTYLGKMLPGLEAPLAKTDPEFVERFELFIAGREHANAYSELGEVVERIAQLDQLIDGVWAHYQRQQRTTGPGSATALFAQALHTYRAARNQVLALAESNRFQEVRDKVPAEVRPAYERVKEMISTLQAAQPPQLQAG